MIRNMGLTDRIVRILFAVMVVALILTEQFKGTVALVMGVIAGILVITSLIGTSLMYIPFKLDSHEQKRE